jgi:Divergent InlB B-repeat domain
MLTFNNFFKQAGFDTNRGRIVRTTVAPHPRDVVARLRSIAVATALAWGCGSGAVGQSHSLISADPQSLDFGSHGQGSITALPITLYNDGSTRLSIHGFAVSGDTYDAFAIGAVPQWIDAGGQATVQVLYAVRHADGKDHATVTFTSNAGNAPELAITLLGSVGTCAAETDGAFCARLAKNCGALSGSDNCGVARSVSSCGICTLPEVCAGQGTANVCETPLFAVNVTLAGHGTGVVMSTPSGIDCGPACTANFSTSVGLTATPGNSSMFWGFSGDCTGATCILSAGGARTVTATFVLK